MLRPTEDNLRERHRSCAAETYSFLGPGTPEPAPRFHFCPQRASLITERYWGGPGQAWGAGKDPQGCCYYDNRRPSPSPLHPPCSPRAFPGSRRDPEASLEALASGRHTYDSLSQVGAGDHSWGDRALSLPVFKQWIQRDDVGGCW